MSAIDSSMVLTREEILSAPAFTALEESERADFWKHFEGAQNLEPDTPEAVSMTEYLQYVQSRNATMAPAFRKTFYLLFLGDRPAAENHFRSSRDIHPRSSCSTLGFRFQECSDDISCKIVHVQYPLCLMNQQMATDLLQWSLDDVSRFSSEIYLSVVPDAPQRSRKAAEHAVEIALELFDGDPTSPQKLGLLKTTIRALRMTSSDPAVSVWSDKLTLLQNILW